MISKELLNFLRDLKKNNHKEWFHKNKPVYQQVRREFEQYIALLIAGIAQFDDTVKSLEPRDCIFRINRDIRFSKDKSPYKTNFGAYIAPGGRKGGYAGYYFHLEPDASFLAGGIDMPSGPSLKAIRNEIFEHTAEFLEILDEPEFKEHFDGLDPIEKLKTAPQGFPKDFEHIDLLNHKHFTVSEPLSEELLTSESLTDHVLSAYQALYPMKYFLNEAIELVRG